MQRIPFLLFHLLIGITLPLQAQISASAELDSTNLLLGDQVQLHIRVNHSPDLLVLEPNLSEFEEAEGIELLSVSAWDTLSPGVLQKNLTITSFDSGYHYVPSIPIAYEENGQTRNVQTPQLALSVNMPQPDSLELAPIKPIIEEPFNWQDTLPYVITIAILVLLGLLIYFLNNREYFFQKIKKPEAVPPPHEVALQKLATLKKAELWQKGEVKAYHSELTHIVREYVETRFDTPALESTTEETLRDLQDYDFWRKWGDRLGEMLRSADLVKFAKAEPAAEFHERMFTYAEQFVHETIPEEKEEETETEEHNT